MRRNLKGFIEHIVSKGELVLIHSDIKKTCWLLREDFEDDKSIINFIIDTFINTLGEEGTLLIPTFNWDFCEGKPFDYKNSPAKTGALPTEALKRKDFKRTKHPIYSFAVNGKLQEEFLACENVSAFGMDSPFGLLWKYDGKIILWDVDYQNSFTFVHFVEQVYNVDYRYEKLFTAPYIDENGIEELRTYSMFVRDLEKGVLTHVNPIGKILEDESISEVKDFYGIKIRVMSAKKSFERISLELKRNSSILITYEKFKDFPTGQEMHDLAKRLFPIDRSLMGEGVRKTLQIIKEYVSELEIKAVKTGEECFDWKVPKDWICEEAYIQELDTGRIVVDFKENNLHVVGYSMPVDEVLTFEELKEHIFYREDLPDAIPYVTSYYSPFWGFCMSYNQFKKLNPNSKYRVVIKSRFIDGELNYGEIVLKGREDKEVFFSTYICHPSLANDNLSGPVLCTFLARYLMDKDRRYTYRFVFVPETIGAICYLKHNLKHLKEKVIAGFVVTCVGDEGEFSYIPSRYGNTLADKLALKVLENCAKGFKKYTYLDRGSDERQYCWPRIDLPVCSVTKTKYGEFKEYHTSLDNLEFVTPKGLEDSLKLYINMVETLENNYKYKTKVLGEPFMRKRNLYPKIGYWNAEYDYPQLLLNILAYSDGTNDLLDLANILQICPVKLIEPIKVLVQEGLLERI